MQNPVEYRPIELIALYHRFCPLSTQFVVIYVTFTQKYSRKQIRRERPILTNSCPYGIVESETKYLLISSVVCFAYCWRRSYGAPFICVACNEWKALPHNSALSSPLPGKGALTHHLQADGGIPPVGRARALSDGEFRSLRRATGNSANLIPCTKNAAAGRSTAAAFFVMTQHCR